MLLNGSTLNSVTLNGNRIEHTEGEPEYVVAGISYAWGVILNVSGTDVAAHLVGSMSVDREEGAAGLADFDLFIEEGVSVVPTDWRNKPVTIDFTCTDQAGMTKSERLFTGVITGPAWSASERILSCECGDQLQQRVEGMPLAAIDTLAGGVWSADLYEPVDGRSRWDYIQERLATVAGSLDCAADGSLRVTSWFAGAPQIVFGYGTTLDQTVEFDAAQLSNVTNRVEVEFSFRYSRLWQLNQHYTWLVPAGSFCAWRVDSHELPTKDMIEDAATDGGQTMINGTFVYLPPSAPDPCGTGSPWINTYPDLLTGAGWTGARRWAQAVTETYTMVFATPEGEVEATQIIKRDSGSLEIESDSIEAWTSDPITGGVSGYSDVLDESRRDLALRVKMLSARTQIIAANRDNGMSWQVPTPMALGTDLTSTLQLDDQRTKGLGKCRRIVHDLDFEAGTAITTISIAIMRGGGSSDALTAPPRLGVAHVDPGEKATDVLPSQIGGRSDSPPYDEDRDGFSGNYDYIDNDVGQEEYPRRITATAPEIPAALRDELALTSESLYRVGIPNNQLEL
ncbi:hypothetical protein [Pseudomonas turukhanskensis]|uniref:Uncharacterized protein n=1 Tax=Pseudomonas turukhanskensis TaxID=1806536 RepID=A0A9W6K4Y4_9PSED|nr:hypothetical protein [Pseudomonas turukhanskensis]GLK88323.1 hypothetical protein GCM10017655_13850 [Pseudomonas turukhanskensis]